MSKLVEEVTSNPKQLAQSADMVIPPPLTAQYADVDRQAARDNYRSRFALYLQPGGSSQWSLTQTLLLLNKLGLWLWWKL